MKIEYNERLRFNHILADEGMMLTDWDGVDIVDYSSATQMYCPETVDLSRYYEVTIEKDMEYRTLQDIAINNKKDAE